MPYGGSYIIHIAVPKRINVWQGNSNSATTHEGPYLLDIYINKVLNIQIKQDRKGGVSTQKAISPRQLADKVYLFQLKMLTNNFDLKVSAAKLEKPLVFNGKVQAVSLPQPGDEVELGYLASILAWTPDAVSTFCLFV